MIDSRIPMAFQPGQQPSLLDIEQQAAQVKALQAQPALQSQQFALNQQRLQAGQMELDQGRRQIEEQKRKEAGLSELSKLWAQHGDDDNAIVTGLNQGGFADVAQAYTTNRAKMREDAFTAEEKRLKNQAEQIKLLGGIAGTIKDEASYQRGIGQALASGLLDARGAAEWLGRPWTPETQAAVAQLAQQSLTAQQQAELQIKQAEDARKALFDAANLDKTKAEAKMKGLEAEGKAPIQPAEKQRLDLQLKQFFETKRHNQASESRQSQMAQAIAQTGMSGQQSQRVMQIAGQFDNEPLVKEFNVIQSGKAFVDSLGTGKNANPGDDQALLYAFAKVMDPNSVVREGEYATVQKYAQSWADTFGFKAERIFSNQPFLTDEARRNLKSTIAKKATVAAAGYENVANEYGRRIERMAGVNDGRGLLTGYEKGYSTLPSPQPGAGGGTPRVMKFNPATGRLE
jgi:hypothetical protein